MEKHSECGIRVHSFIADAKPVFYVFAERLRRGFARAGWFLQAERREDAGEAV
jgi:hypothetical protein